MENNSIKNFVIDSTEYISRIYAHYNNLSEAEKKIADYILENKNSLLFYNSIGQLSTASNVSASTIVRFCKSLGFKGFSEFKFYMEKAILTPIGGTVKIGSDDSASAIKQKACEFAKNALNDTMLIVDDDALERAISAISGAKRLELYGEGSSGGVAFAAANTFLNLGIASNAHSDPFAQIMMAANLKKGDVAIGISNRGTAKNTVDSLMIAQQNGATTICITGRTCSPITKYADIILYTSSRSIESIQDIPAASICQLFIINTIQTGVLVRNRDKLSDRIIKVRNATKHKTIVTK